ncbi:hypothetical protein ILYODFUR_009706 [Ilyodon furcidens]|uniref:Uncharacterized protein n=1 Tax=Ilyodon furcidens TaxID=33524 RepID=A0ABV0UHU2_9TELE
MLLDNVTWPVMDTDDEHCDVESMCHVTGFPRTFIETASSDTLAQLLIFWDGWEVLPSELKLRIGQVGRKTREGNHASVINSRNRGENTKDRLVDCINKEETHLLGNKTSVGFSPAPGVSVVFDRYMNLLTFLSQTDFQLSSSSEMALWSKSSPASFCLSRYAPPLRRPVRHAGNGHETLFTAGFTILGDVRAAMSVELRMFNCATKMNDSNILLCNALVPLVLKQTLSMT